MEVLFHYNMMTSSNGIIFRVTGPLWGESTGHRWIPNTKASDAELWCFLWSANQGRGGPARNNSDHYLFITHGCNIHILLKALGVVLGIYYKYGYIKQAGVGVCV